MQLRRILYVHRMCAYKGTAFGGQASDSPIPVCFTPIPQPVFATYKYLAKRHGFDGLPSIIRLKAVCAMQVAEKHGSLKVVVYEGLKWHHHQAQEDSRLNKKRPPNRNKAAVSTTPCPHVCWSCALHLPSSSTHLGFSYVSLWVLSSLQDMLSLSFSGISGADQSSLWCSHQSVASSVSSMLHQWTI